ncbi:T9SS type A sorting domain-containing protein [Dyadobacter frigoris]|uniref:T9SS type A sorting domain-containing protein n=1 Tax=Dyadobacter frigoris TaxID=2576211 RepID=A0A4U6CSR3_9BACT|nr:T9SS type A sorting domain-containing protein [Dyadobacter frigoris]TKT87622.1 T9SS type A sorting domain-containing protein [Dyadobacter frigoris]GLU52683.1 hypothetical protein Dfri01_21440 [Dyadobacter frigoris]
MKRYLLFCQLALLYSFNAHAQFTTGSNGLFTSPGTDVYIYGLTFRPTTAFSITNKTLTISSVALAGTPPSITRVFNFDAPFGFVGRLGLFYLASELNGNTETSLQVVHKDVATIITTGSVVNTTTHYIYNDLASPITFSTATAAQPGALPVTLVSFTAKKEGAVANLNWSTSAESNSDYFEVQHSNDAKSWSLLSKVAAASESSTLKSYGYTQSNPGGGSNFYRLKMVDKDQSFAYSRVQELVFTRDLNMALYPNPVVEKINIQVDNWSEISSLQLLNSQGISFFESKGKVLSREIDMKRLPAGLYLVQLKKTDGTTHVIKVIKQ